MLRDGAPIYPLGSVQDAAMQFSLMKDQAKESFKFYAQSQVSFMSLMLIKLASSTKGQTKFHELYESYSQLIDDTSYIISYRDSEIPDRAKLEEKRFKEMDKLVGSFTGKTVKIKKR